MTTAMILYYVAVMLLAWRRRNLFLGVVLFVATITAVVLVQDRFMQTQLAQNVAASAVGRTEAEDGAILWAIGAFIATMRILLLIGEKLSPWAYGVKSGQPMDSETALLLRSNGCVFFVADLMMMVYFAVALADTTGMII